MTTSSAARVLVIRVESANAPIVALVARSVLAFIVEFTVNVLTVSAVSDNAETKKVLVVNVLNVALVPVTVLRVRVDWTDS